MSTRAAIHFEYPGSGDTEAIVYRHSDGYPDGLGQDLVRFIEEVRTLRDTRLGDPSYLAAKWVVFDVLEHQAYMAKSNADNEKIGQEPYYMLERLGFLGTGIVNKDPSDIEYRYHVVCDGKVETIAWDGGFGDKWDEHGVMKVVG